ncbi:hypothetical protein C6P74_17335 [Burkholderia multivorans]|nr:hypothetical protein C6P74_17335 [Burkholderia multivorans]PRE74323.1 hypothetical protein C6Q02_30570 [Burkholderia multivorans]
MSANVTAPTTWSAFIGDTHRRHLKRISLRTPRALDEMARRDVRATRARTGKTRNAGEVRNGPARMRFAGPTTASLRSNRSDCRAT